MAGLAATMGSGAMTNSLDEIASSKVALIIGANITWNHPVFGGMIKRAVRENGLKLIVCDPRRIDLVDWAEIWLRPKNGSDVALLMGMQHLILKLGLEDKAYIGSRLENFENYQKSLEFYTPEKVEELTGVSITDLTAAAKLYAVQGRGALYYCMGITQHSHGVDNVKACVNLQMVTGNIGFAGGGVNPLRGQNNVQGACDMGGLPNVYTGYQNVNDAAVRRKFADYWGIEEQKLSLENGLTLTSMINECGEKIKALYIFGENPVLSDPNLGKSREALANLHFLLVQDIFLTETAQMADVVLPGAALPEKYGTVTNSERRIQLTSQALQPPGQARPDLEIIAEIANRFGAEFSNSPPAWFQEIRELTPSYRGVTYDRIKEVGLQWPCPSEDHEGTRFMHKDRFARGKGKLTPLQFKAPAEEIDHDWPLVLSTGRILQHFHTGSMTRRSRVLNNLVAGGYVEINPRDARQLRINTGQKVRVMTRRGSVVTTAFITERVARGSLFFPFHFAEAPANLLTNDALDPVAGIPEYKVCAARLEKEQNER